MFPANTYQIPQNFHDCLTHFTEHKHTRGDEGEKLNSEITEDLFAHLDLIATIKSGDKIFIKRKQDENLAYSIEKRTKFVNWLINLMPDFFYMLSLEEDLEEIFGIVGGLCDVVLVEMLHNEKGLILYRGKVSAALLGLKELQKTYKNYSMCNFRSDQNKIEEVCKGFQKFLKILDLISSSENICSQFCRLRNGGDYSLESWFAFKDLVGKSSARIEELNNLLLEFKNEMSDTIEQCVHLHLYNLRFYHDAVMKSQIKIVLTKLLIPVPLVNMILSFFLDFLP